MASSLEEAVCSYKSHLEQITELRKETTRCLQEIIQSLTKQDCNQEGLTALKALELPDSELSNRPCVLFIGSQNCGKSTLLNTFLRKSQLLPTDETPCTSRIVRIVYSDKNHTKIQDPITKHETRKSFKKNKIPKELISLEGDARNNPDDLKVIVEVGLNHPLLECGIELIDSPGRNENDALDKVVEEFIEKGIVPLIVYIIDGNYHIRDKDRTTIRELQDKFPNVTLMFVCTKVDMDEKALRFDHGDEDDDQDLPDGENKCQKMFELAQKKKVSVFNELKRLSFLPPDEQMGTSEIFHGVSAKLFKKACKEKLHNDARMNFERFEKCILEKLESSLRKQTKRELALMHSAQEMLLATVLDAQISMDVKSTKMKTDIDRFKETEEAIFTMIEQLINRDTDIVKEVGHDLEKLSSIILKEVEEFQCPGKGTKDAALDFIRQAKESILDRSFNVLRRSFQRAISSTALTSVIITKLNNTLINPLLRRVFQRTLLGNEDATLPRKEDRKGFTAYNYVTLTEVMLSVDEDISTLLRSHLKAKIGPFDIMNAAITRPRRPQDQSAWRRNIAQTILSTIDIKQLTAEVIRAIHKALFRKRQNVQGKMNAIQVLTGLGGRSTRVANYLPHIAHLAVRGHSLRYVIERGVPELGQQLQSTTHGQLYLCSSPLWVGESGQSMVKVVNKNVVEKEFWGQTMRDCMHFKNIKERLMLRHPNLLELRGWYMPEPDQLYLVMDVAECDLLTALKQGLSWTRRKEVAVDVARGLEAIHSVSYIYQDLKPQNIMLTKDGTAKINLCKTEKPFETTELGVPFHISPEMHEKHELALYGSFTYDIYAFGSLLWVLCEGTGTHGPQAYAKCQDKDDIKVAVCNGLKPERPNQTPDAWWDLMGKCWQPNVFIQAVLRAVENLDIPEDQYFNNIVLN